MFETTGNYSFYPLLKLPFPSRDWNILAYLDYILIISFRADEELGYLTRIKPAFQDFPSKSNFCLPKLPRGVKKYLPYFTRFTYHGLYSSLFISLFYLAANGEFGILSKIDSDSVIHANRMFVCFCFQRNSLEPDPIWTVSCMLMSLVTKQYILNHGKSYQDEQINKKCKQQNQFWHRGSKRRDRWILWNAISRLFLVSQN